MMEDLPNELVVDIFAFVGGGSGYNDDVSPPKSIRNTITVDEVREMDEVLPLVCKRWREIYNENKTGSIHNKKRHRIIGPLQLFTLECHSPAEVSWIQRNQARVGYIELHVLNVPDWSFMYTARPQNPTIPQLIQERTHLSHCLQAFLQENDTTQLVHFHFCGWRAMPFDERTTLKEFVPATCPLLKKFKEDRRFHAYFSQKFDNKRKRDGRI